eukprot:COSAG06_NODE_39317_length_414_cov_0.641270_1_plen_20_part_10
MRTVDNSVKVKVCARDVRAL